jgi:hypothetical protein
MSGRGARAMKLLETVNWSDAEIEAFEAECFRQWLNKVDAYSDYDWRIEHSLVYWRELYDEGHSPKSAIATCKEFGE